MTALDVRPSPTAAPAARAELLGLPEVRWAAIALAAFVVGGLLWLADAPAWASGPVLAVCYLAGGWEPAVEGLRALRERTLDVDLLMVVAALGAAAIGQVLDGALLIVIFATSGALEAWATARTERSVGGLLSTAPETATRVADDGSEAVCEAADLAVGDVVVVRPGAAIPADGLVVEGAAEIDRASITGEPLPVPAGVGTEVYAGTVATGGTLRVRVSRPAAESVVARIAVLVEEASRTKARTQLFVEKVEQRYSVGVVVATLAIFAVPLALGSSLDDALLRAMTFMIVASPCALVLATMPPLLAAAARAGRRGLLVRSAQVMERLADVDAVVLDKTGTVTEGRPRVVGVPDDEVLRLAAAVETGSEHPLGRAVVAAACERGLTVPPVEDFVAAPGVGVRGVVGGRRIGVGRASSQPAATTTPVAVTDLDDGSVLGTLEIADALRPDAADAVGALAARTVVPPVLATGDAPGPAREVGRRIGVADVRAELLPEDKVDVVADVRRPGRTVAVVGDGVNDAPALAAADVGVAMRGSDLTMRAADVVVLSADLARLPWLLDLARRARRIVVANLVIAGTLIVGLVTWDLVGHLPLALGVAGHEGSTILVALNGLRLLREPRRSSGNVRDVPRL
ncbi:heavy metal translocating P-type ATPase [Actinomycetospora termitidis]|uniref:Heavy metal translocating P-type ATPase n=1 Tax=Actinomycetospora termitidis TaxID=3053470 RepID=A0ABT7M747_9PSEU|nr:heavy metal translocating P-type ATPase [Actinomycetospora sp. Odt1-22]MDL5156495.1 heavy metal translocating P-type ATPase [Actinomycetospora sp. Odt1-22]